MVTRLNNWFLLRTAIFPLGQFRTSTVQSRFGLSCLEGPLAPIPRAIAKDGVNFRSILSGHPGLTHLQLKKCAKTILPIAKLTFDE